MIIQIIGLPGSGKTALATALKERINAIHLNADEVRSTVNSDLGFTAEDRIEQARRMGEMARLIANQGVAPVIVDFVCPTKETREAFGPADVIVWVDRIKQGRFEDTNKMWQDPERFDIRILDGYTLEQEVDTVIQVGALFDWSAPTTLQLGRYQPWHEGHQALKEEAHKRTKQVLVGADLKLIATGLVDVRRAQDVKALHARGQRHRPLDDGARALGGVDNLQR